MSNENPPAADPQPEPAASTMPEPAAEPEPTEQPEPAAQPESAAQPEVAQEHDPEKHDTEAGADLRQRGDWTADAAGGPQVWDAEGNLVEGTDPAHPEGSSSEPAEDGESSGPRTSELDEVRDGGYSVGSAAPLEDGAVPLGHAVKAWEDTKTYVLPEEEGYGDHAPDVWFTDADAARRAGFGPAH